MIPNSKEFSRLSAKKKLHILSERKANVKPGKDKITIGQSTRLTEKEELAYYLACYLTTLDKVEVTVQMLDSWTIGDILDWVEAWDYDWTGSEWEILDER